MRIDYAKYINQMHAMYFINWAVNIKRKYALQIFGVEKNTVRNTQRINKRKEINE